MAQFQNIGDNNPAAGGIASTEILQQIEELLAPLLADPASQAPLMHGRQHLNPFDCFGP
jgi:hypothetical protein